MGPKIGCKTLNRPPYSRIFFPRRDLLWRQSILILKKSILTKIYCYRFSSAGQKATILPDPTAKAHLRAAGIWAPPPLAQSAARAGFSIRTRILQCGKGDRRTHPYNGCMTANFLREFWTRSDQKNLNRLHGRILSQQFQYRPGQGICLRQHACARLH
jgi:hypothetical protein